MARYKSQFRFDWANSNVMRNPKVALRLLVLGLFLARTGLAVAPAAVFTLPLNCAELMPDPTPFSGFLDAVARSHVKTDRKFSKRIFRVLAFRERLSEPELRAQEFNPVDTLIRKTLCFYREQKEPIKGVTVDDEKFIQFLRSSLPELENKVEETVFQVEYERQQRLAYEKKVQGSQGLIDSLKGEADREAERTLKNLTRLAKKKVARP